MDIAQYFEQAMKPYQQEMLEKQASELVKKGAKTEVEQLMADVALQTMKEKTKDMQPVFLGADLLEASPDGDKGCVVFGLRFGRKIVQVPAVFIRGRIKGTEMMYLADEDLFVPFEEGWVDKVRSGHMLDLGIPVGGNNNLGKPSLDFRPPMTQGPLSVSQGQFKRASLGKHVDEYPHDYGLLKNWPSKAIPKSEAKGLDLEGFLKKANYSMGLAFMNMLKSDKDAQFYLMNYYGPEGLTKLAAAAMTSPASDGDVSESKVEVVFNSPVEPVPKDLDPEDYERAMSGAIVVKDNRQADDIFKIVLTQAELHMHSIPGPGRAHVIWPVDIPNAIILDEMDKNDLYCPGPSTPYHNYGTQDRNYIVIDLDSNTKYECRSHSLLITDFVSVDSEDNNMIGSSPSEIRLDNETDYYVVDPRSNKILGQIYRPYYDGGNKRRSWTKKNEDDKITFTSDDRVITFVKRVPLGRNLPQTHKYSIADNMYSDQVRLVPYKNCEYMRFTKEDALPLLELNRYKIVDSRNDPTQDEWVGKQKTVTVDTEDFQYTDKRAAMRHLIVDHGLTETDADRILDVPDVYYLEKEAQPLLQNDLTSQTETPIDTMDSSDESHRVLKEFFDTSMISKLMKTNDAGDYVEENLGDFTVQLDKIARLLFLIYWKPEDFAERLGDDAVNNLEALVRNAFENLGEVILELHETRQEPTLD